MLFLHIAFAVLLLACGSKSYATDNEQPLLTICTGARTAPDWQLNVKHFIDAAFAGTGLKAELWNAPTKRAEHLFANKRCGGFFVSDINFPETIKRDDIIHVPVAILTARIEFYKRAENSCSTTKRCLALYTEHDRVGVYSSNGLAKYAKMNSEANVIELNTVNKGIKMLIKNRIDGFIAPQIANIERSSKPSQAHRLDAIMEDIELYLWLDKRYQPYITHLTKAFSEQTLVLPKHPLIN